MAAYGSALTAGHFLKSAKSNQKRSAPTLGTSPRLGVPSLRLESVGNPASPPGSYRTAFAFALHHSSRLSGRCAFAFDFDLRRPVKHAGRNSAGIWGVNRQGCWFSRPAPWMARGGGPPNHCRITGIPSLGEVPSVGARALWLLWGFSKVTRRKGGTIRGRYPNNGYVHPPPQTNLSRQKH